MLGGEITLFNLYGHWGIVLLIKWINQVSNPSYTLLVYQPSFLKTQSFSNNINVWLFTGTNVGFVFQQKQSPSTSHRTCRFSTAIYCLFFFFCCYTVTVIVHPKEKQLCTIEQVKYLTRVWCKQTRYILKKKLEKL